MSLGLVADFLEENIARILLQDLAFILLLERLVITCHFLQIVSVEDS
jgi:hypothetical protein